MLVWWLPGRDCLLLQHFYGASVSWERCQCLGSRLARTVLMPGQRWRSQVMAASNNWVNCYTPLGQSSLRIKLVWNDRWPCDHSIGAMGAEFSECMFVFWLGDSGHANIEVVVHLLDFSALIGYNSYILHTSCIIRSLLVCKYGIIICN